jgi:hypothetical protein
MYGYHQPHYQPSYHTPVYTQTTNEYLGPAKVLEWTPVERELLERTLPVEADRELASIRRAREIYEPMTEYEREDWDVDLWGQQLFRYDLDDQRDRLERELTYAQDKIRAEKDEIWEFYKKKTQYKHDDDRVLDDHEEYGDDYGYGYGQKAVQQENLYDNYDKLDVRETILRANQLWDGDVLMYRQAWRELNEETRAGHRGAVAEIVARREAEIAGLKAAVIERRMDKRADLAVSNAELDQAIRDLIAAGNAEVGALNDIHQALVLRILEAVDWQGEESDIKLILTQAGESDIDLYGETDVSGLWEEERTASWNPAQMTSSSWGRQHAYTRPSYG